MGIITSEEIRNHKEKEETHNAPEAVLMERIIIIRDKQEAPIRKDAESDIVRYNEKINRGLNIGWFKKNSGRE